MIRNRQTRTPCRYRQTHCDSAVLLLPHLAAVLTRDPDRMLPFLRKPGVVHDPRPPVLASASWPTHAYAPAPALLHHSKAPSPPNDARTGASAECALDVDLDGQPLARCSCVRRATAVPCNSSSKVCAGLRAPRRSPGSLYMPRSVFLVGLARRGVFPQNNSTSECFFYDPVVLARYSARLWWQGTSCSLPPFSCRRTQARRPCTK